MKSKKIIMSRLTSVKKADNSFDLKFWKKVGVLGKWNAAWQMVLDLKNWNPSHVRQQRLRRSVALLKRIGS